MAAYEMVDVFFFFFFFLPTELAPSTRTKRTTPVFGVFFFFLRTELALYFIIIKILISLSHSKHTHSPRNAHSASAEGTDPV